MQPVNGQQQQNRVVAAENQPIGRGRHSVHEWGPIIVLFAAALVFPWLHRLAPWKFVAAYCVSAAAWLVLVVRDSRITSVSILLVLAVFLRLIPLAAEPRLSGDMYRYLWDGRVGTQGINPYDQPPESPALESLREAWHPLINHPDIRTIYPPLAQVVFSIYAWISSSVVGWKLFLLLFDLGTILLLSRVSAPVALGYATSPLVLIEGFWSGHLEIAVVCCLVAAVLLSRRNTKSVGSAAMLAAAAGLKLVPLVALPSFMRAAKSPMRFGIVFVVFMILPALPYIQSSHFMSGMEAYATRWSFNSPVHEVVDFAVRESGVVPDLRNLWGTAKDSLRLETISPLVYRHLHADFLVRALMGVLLVTGLCLAYRSEPSLACGSTSMMGTLLLLSPTIHPWYWLPVLPLALMGRQWLWILLASLSPASYLLYHAAPAGRVMAYVVGYGIPFATAAVIQRRQRATGNRQ